MLSSLFCVFFFFIFFLSWSVYISTGLTLSKIISFFFLLLFWKASVHRRLICTFYLCQLHQHIGITFPVFLHIGHAEKKENTKLSCTQRLSANLFLYSILQSTFYIKAIVYYSKCVCKYFVCKKMFVKDGSKDVKVLKDCAENCNFRVPNRGNLIFGKNFTSEAL